MPQEKLSRQVLLVSSAVRLTRGRPRSKWSDYIFDLAWSRAGVEPAGLSEIAVDREVFQILFGVLFRSPIQGKSGNKMNGWNMPSVIHTCARLQHRELINVWNGWCILQLISCIFRFMSPKPADNFSSEVFDASEPSTIACQQVYKPCDGGDCATNVRQICSIKTVVLRSLSILS